MQAHSESRGIALLFLTPALDGGGGGVGGQRQVPAALPPGKIHGTHCVGGSLGPRAGLDVCGKPRSHRESIPGPWGCVIFMNVT